MIGDGLPFLNCCCRGGGFARVKDEIGDFRIDELDALFNAGAFASSRTLAVPLDAAGVGDGVVSSWCPSVPLCLLAIGFSATLEAFLSTVGFLGD